LFIGYHGPNTICCYDFQTKLQTIYNAPITSQ
jgi:hypothetical protein